jgi:SAM-dependent methyltransferase
MNAIPWYQAFFGEDYLRIYAPFLPAERTAREVAGIINLLNLPTGSAILDLCCGHGRHAIPLAQQGYQITGQDLSEAFLQRAENEARVLGIKARWVQGDMRTIPFENEFDAVINIFTSFGYLASEEEDLQVLQQVHKALKPGGLFLLETVYQPKVIRAFSPHGIIRYDDGLIVLEERHIDLLTSRNEVHITMLYPDGRRTEHHQSMRIYTLTELIRMQATVGLQVQAYYGGLDGSGLTMDSRLVVISRKAT